MVRSSLPFNSPLMTTDLPMCTTSLAPAGRASELRGHSRGAGVVAAAGGAGVGGVGGLTASSRFHMFHDLQAQAHSAQGATGVVGLHVPGNLARQYRQSLKVLSSRFIAEG